MVFIWTDLDDCLVSKHSFQTAEAEKREKERHREESDFQSCAFFLLYAFGFAGFRVTGLMDQVSRRLEFIALCFFLESFS